MTTPKTDKEVMALKAEEYCQHRLEKDDSCVWVADREGFKAGYQSALRNSPVVRELVDALKSIEDTCFYYAMTHRGPEHEVHHALKVELLQETRDALANYEREIGAVGKNE